MKKYFKEKHHPSGSSIIQEVIDIREIMKNGQIERPSPTMLPRKLASRNIMSMMLYFIHDRDCLNQYKKHQG